MGSVRAMSINFRSMSWLSRCEYTKISCSLTSVLLTSSYNAINSSVAASFCPAQKRAFRRRSDGSSVSLAMAISHLAGWSPSICDMLKITFSFKSESSS